MSNIPSPYFSLCHRNPSSFSFQVFDLSFPFSLKLHYCFNVPSSICRITSSTELSFLSSSHCHIRELILHNCSRLFFFFVTNKIFLSLNTCFNFCVTVFDILVSVCQCNHYQEECLQRGNIVTLQNM